MKKLSLICVLLAIVSCQSNHKSEFKEIEQSVFKSILKPDEEAKTNGIRSQIKPLNEFNKFEVTIMWDEDLAEEYDLIQRYEDPRAKKRNLGDAIIQIKKGLNKATDIVNGGQTYTYFLIKKGATRNNALFTQVKVLADLEVNQNTPAIANLLPDWYYFSSQKSENTFEEAIAPVKLNTKIFTSVKKESPLPVKLELNRLYFRDGAELKIEDRSLDIQAEEIISDNGKIITFGSGKSSGMKDGRAAGNISIRAKKASGSLEIVGNGEHGSDGEDGKKGKNGKDGAKGERDGEWGVNHALPEARRNYVASYAGNIKNLPPTDPTFRDVFNGIPHFICVTFPRDGQPGENGFPGEDGENGGNGGNSSNVSIEILEDSPFKVTVSNKPGTPGLGGRSGEGGDGGKGGEPANRDSAHLCPPAKKGIDGKKGKLGRQGLAGAFGIKQPVCVKISAKSYYDCDTRGGNHGIRR